MTARMTGPIAIPGPPRRSLAGYSSYIRALDREPLAYVQRMFEAYGPMSALVAGDARLVFALGPAANQQLLANPQVYRPDPQQLTHPGRTSATIRQLGAVEQHEQDVQPLAATWQRYLEEGPARSAYAEAVTAFTRQMVEQWGCGQQLDLVYVLRRLHLRILLQTLLGLNTADDESQLLLHHLIINSSTQAPVLTGVPGLARRRQRRVLTYVTAAVQSATPEHFLWTLPGGHDGAGSERAAAELVQQIAQLINAIEAPLTSALTWTLLLLSQHERVLSDVRAELRAAPQLSGEGAHLPLLERVIKESLRLLPPRTLGVRQTTGPIELLGYALPQGATVVYSPLLTHRLASLLVTPRRFRPERWLYIEPSGDDYLPLGEAAQPSQCLGFLLQHTKLVLATLLERSRLVLAAGAQLDYRLHPVLLPKAELPMIVAPLERKLIRREVRGTVGALVDFTSS